MEQSVASTAGLTNEDVSVDFDFDAMEELLNNDIEEMLSDLNSLDERREEIGNPDALGDIVLNTVWEQLLINISSETADEFVKENGGKSLNLSKSAHIQTTENFKNGNIASHNTEIDYQKRYDDYQKNFQKDVEGNIQYHTDKTGARKETLVKNSRKPYDKNRPAGSKKNNTNMDHTVSAGELMRDPEANTHLSELERINFANSDSNLNEIRSDYNQSKSDLSMTEWLEKPNKNGQTPKEIFNLDDNQIKELKLKDKEARKAKDELIQKGKEKSIESGKKTRKEEAFKVGGKVLRTIAIRLLLEFIKEFIRDFVEWLKSPNKNIKSLLGQLKVAIKNYISNLKKHLTNAVKDSTSMIISTIIAPISRTFTKVISLLKQGYKSLSGAIKYIENPENKGKPTSIMVAEIGKIVTMGFTATGTMILGDIIEKGLMSVPVFAFEIPLFGSLASIVGLVIGGLVSGIIGAIVINLIDKFIANKKRHEIEYEIYNKQNNVVEKQHVQKAILEKSLLIKKENSFNNMRKRHEKANDETNELLGNIFKPLDEDDYKVDMDAMQQNLDALL